MEFEEPGPERRFQGDDGPERAFDPDEGTDGETSTPLLPPDDRLWRHPSEMAGAAAGRPRARSREPRLVTVVALTSCISALLSLGLVAVFRPLRTHVPVERIATPMTPSGGITGVADAAALAEFVRPAITQVIARSDAGEQWGSGVIYRSDGMMLTSHHVVSGADSLRVLLDDGREVPAQTIGTDPDTDIAVLRLDGANFKTAVLGSTRDLKVGQPAITIGSPMGGAPGPVVRVGVVSALGQEVDTGGRNLVDMIQTDGAVAPGCSGAAVVDGRGAVIGIAASNANTEAGVIGYATPIDVARAVAAQLLDGGKVSWGWLGVEAETLGAERARELGVAGGAVVKLVKPGSPAERSGLRVSDVLVAVNAATVESMSALVIRLRGHRPGDTVKLSVLRDGQTREVKATLAEKPS